MNLLLDTEYKISIQLCLFFSSVCLKSMHNTLKDLPIQSRLALIQAVNSFSTRLNFCLTWLVILVCQPKLCKLLLLTQIWFKPFLTIPLDLIPNEIYSSSKRIGCLWTVQGIIAAYKYIAQRNDIIPSNTYLECYPLSITHSLDILNYCLSYHSPHFFYDQTGFFVM